MSAHADEVAEKQRFEFGENWRRFLATLNEERITLAEQSLLAMLGLKDLGGKRFLDVGCGSGLFSLAARRLGATVHSFDFDPESVACARQLKDRFCPGDPLWIIEQGSVLDGGALGELGTFDVVYSWGVLHHTGAMWNAMDNITSAVAEGGLLYLSIYNFQPFLSSYWRRVKIVYNHAPVPVRRAMEYGFYLYFVAGLGVADLIRGWNPLDRHAGRGRRGMNVFHDVVDWIGGWPFEVAAPEEVFRFYRDRGFALRELKTCGAKHGCNEFVFVRSTAPSPV